MMSASSTSNNGRSSMAGRSLALIRTVRKKGVVHPVEVMTGIGLEVEPFTEPVDEWNAWDVRPWPED